MKLSEYIQHLKDEGESRSSALNMAKKVVDASGNPWTTIKKKLFDSIWGKKEKTVKPPPKIVAPPTKSVLKHTPVAPVHTPVPKVAQALPLSVEQKLEAWYNKMGPESPLSEAIKFYTYAWEHFNSVHFSNKLPKPAYFKYLKDTGKFFRIRAYYMPGFNAFGFSKRLFHTSFENFCNTFVHEMCHQAVHKIDGSQGYRKPSGRRDIHGEPWKKWMRHCKLDPERCDKSDVTDYMDEREKTEVLTKRDERKNEEQKYTQLTVFKDGTVAQFYNDKIKEWVTGVLVCPERTGNSKRYLFADTTSGTSYKLVPKVMLFKVTDPGDLDIYTQFHWQDHAIDIRNKYLGMKKLDAHIRLSKKAARGKIGDRYFDIGIIPQNRRNDYVIVCYLLKSSVAKGGIGEFPIARLSTMYGRADTINAIYWWSEIAGLDYVRFREREGILRICEPYEAEHDGRYSIEDFQKQLNEHYGESSY